MEELQEIHSQGNTIIMVTHNPALTTYATRVINMLDGEIDTDIKTVDDSELPRGGKNEKVSVKVLPSRDPIQMEITSESDVVVSGENVTTEEAPEEKAEEKETKKPAVKKSSSKKSTKKKSTSKKKGAKK
jgi:energy-coupling factor transporter ATP-binding protein EcfA2